MQSFYSLTNTGLLLKVHVVPGSSQTSIAGYYGDRLKIKLTARANDNQANLALCAFLASYFSLPKSSVTIKNGHSSRQKTILLTTEPKKIINKLEILTQTLTCE